MVKSKNAEVKDLNNTTKAKYDMAARMLKGRIEAEEVALMSGLSIEEVNKLKEEVVPQNSEVEMLKNLDSVDLNIGEILYDDLPAEDEDLEGFKES
jgi:hypothetical protein